MQSVVELGPGASSVILGRYGPYRLLEAPLTPQSFGGRVIEWYDPAFIEELPDRIDALVVDGPRYNGPFGSRPCLAAAPRSHATWGACSCR